ncbi:MAG: chorismate lyase [Legionellaceae bacterium]|nr:chorismate lyase [Legionellaceae bacterium]
MIDKPPAQLIPWLEHQGSITDKLKALSGEARLQLLKHTWELTDTWDQNTLNLEPNHSVLHREILMWAHNEPCWFARTVLPKTTYQAEEALFSRLETTPLGELIHHHSDIKRTSIKPYPILPNSMEHAYLTHALDPIITPLWGRCSTFTLRTQHDFYLLEIFLPKLLKLIRYCT